MGARSCGRLAHRFDFRDRQLQVEQRLVPAVACVLQVHTDGARFDQLARRSRDLVRARTISGFDVGAYRNFHGAHDASDAGDHLLA